MKKKLKLFLSILFSFQICLNNNLLSEQGWFQTTSIGSNYIRGIYFKDINNGIIGGYKTSNGGLNWVYTNASGTSMMFPDINTGYIVEHNLSIIYKTTNFANNWSAQYLPYQLYCVYFPSIYTGYAFGYSSSFVKTTNGGYNWQIMNVSENLYAFNVFFINNSLGFVSGFGGTYLDSNIILKTTNGGNNWSRCFIIKNSVSLTLPIFFINSNTGYAGASQFVYKTTNSGINWVAKNSSTQNVINSIYFSNISTGYGVCNNGDIIKSTDSGENWFRQFSPSQSTLNTVFFINSQTGYICAEDGTVLKTIDGGGPPIGIKSISNEVPKDFSLGQNYPNPFNPNTKIKFSLPLPSQGGGQIVRLVIYDILGREVAILLNQQLRPGSYDVSFDGTNYPSGVYFYKIKAGDFVETRKMVLIK